MPGKKMEKWILLLIFSFKGKIKGKIGTFKFENKKIIQDLEIYKVKIINLQSFNSFLIF